MGKQEILLVGNLIGASLVSLAASAYPLTRFFSFIVVRYCLLLRIFRMSVTFPAIAKFQRILFLSLNSFMPLLAMVLCFILFTAVAATITMGQIEPDYGDSSSSAFLAEHYHFKDYYHSYITLLAMATVTFSHLLIGDGLI